MGADIYRTLLLNLDLREALSVNSLIFTLTPGNGDCQYPHFTGEERALAFSWRGSWVRGRSTELGGGTGALTAQSGPCSALLPLMERGWKALEGEGTYVSKHREGEIREARLP